MKLFKISMSYDQLSWHSTYAFIPTFLGTLCRLSMQSSDFETVKLWWAKDHLSYLFLKIPKYLRQCMSHYKTSVNTYKEFEKLCI